MDVNEMKSLLSEPLRPFGFLDVLPFYCLASFFLEGFAGEREIASRIWIPNGPRLLKRATKLSKLTVSDMRSISGEEFFRKRKYHLKDSGVEGIERVAWQYFPPRKLVDFFYATNHEGRGKPIERVFFDIDRKGIGAEEARVVAVEIVERLEKELAKEVPVERTFQTWTGKSFHVYAFLSSPMDRSRYEELFSSEGKFRVWAEEIEQKTGIPASWGHEKIEGRIIIDPSQTPSGKLDRMPFSLHMKDAKTVDGVALPLSRKMIEKQGIAEKLLSIDIKEVVENIEKWAENLP